MISHQWHLHSEPVQVMDYYLFRSPFPTIFEFYFKVTKKKVKRVTPSDSIEMTNE